MKISVPPSTGHFSPRFLQLCTCYVNLQLQAAFLSKIQRSPAPSSSFSPTLSLSLSLPINLSIYLSFLLALFLPSSRCIPRLRRSPRRHRRAVKREVYLAHGNRPRSVAHTRASITQARFALIAIQFVINSVHRNVEEREDALATPLSSSSSLQPLLLLLMQQPPCGGSLRDALRVHAHVNIEILCCRHIGKHCIRLTVRARPA